MGLNRNSVGVKSVDRGLEIKKHRDDDKVIALAGNPNVGKSTVFNEMTKMNQHTGNWPGKTVANAQGYAKNGKQGYVMVDIPGCYSLMAQSTEEEVARDFICFENPDAVVVVCDATCLERNLNLVLQIMEAAERVVVCVNLMDEAEKKAISIRLKLLEERLGVPVIGTAARSKRGLGQIYEGLERVLHQGGEKLGTAIDEEYAVKEKIGFLEENLKGNDEIKEKTLKQRKTSEWQPEEEKAERDDLEEEEPEKGELEEEEAQEEEPEEGKLEETELEEERLEEAELEEEKLEEAEPGEGKLEEAEPGEGKLEEAEPEEGKLEGKEPEEEKLKEEEPEEGKLKEEEPEEGRLEEGKLEEAELGEGKLEEAELEEGKLEEEEPEEEELKEEEPEEEKLKEEEPEEGKLEEGELEEEKLKEEEPEEGKLKEEELEEEEAQEGKLEERKPEKGKLEEEQPGKLPCDEAQVFEKKEDCRQFKCEACKEERPEAKFAGSDRDAARKAEIHMLKAVTARGNLIRYPEYIEGAIARLVPAVRKATDSDVDIRWLSARLLDSNENLMAAVKKYLAPVAKSDEIAALLKEIREEWEERGISQKRVSDDMASVFVKKAELLCQGAVTFGNKTYDKKDRVLDHLFTSKATGFPIMFLILLGVFWLTITGANYPSKIISMGLFWFEDRLSEIFMALGVPTLMIDVALQGIYRVLAWVVSVMLPPMAIFFPLFTLLEDFGYLPRVAFNLDRCFKRCSACGKQALTMCMGCVNLQLLKLSQNDSNIIIVNQYFIN